jgi:hypothetical protein
MRTIGRWIIFQRLSRQFGAYCRSCQHDRDCSRLLIAIGAQTHARHIPVFNRLSRDRCLYPRPVSLNFSCSRVPLACLHGRDIQDWHRQFTFATQASRRPAITAGDSVIVAQTPRGGHDGPFAAPILDIHNPPLPG